MDLLLFWQDMREKLFLYFTSTVSDKDKDLDQFWHVNTPVMAKVIYEKLGAEFGSTLKL